MCARFTVFATPQELADLFQIEIHEEISARYNIAPSQEIATVLDGPEGRHLEWMRWGFVPFWAKEMLKSGPLINARAETIFEKPSFRTAIRRHRCLIPASGFFEWDQKGAPGAKKQPYLIRPAGEGPMALGGIWDTWTNPEGVTESTCAIVTTEADDLVAKLHDRMPVVVEPEDFGLWLDPGVETSEALMPLLAPLPSSLLVSYKVTTAMNNPRHDSAENVVAVA